MDHKAFDQLFKEKVGEANRLYAEEIQVAKPYAWTAIQAALYPQKRAPKWWFLAAACLLLLLSFGGFLFWQMEVRHQQSMALLSEQLQQLKGEKHMQINRLQTKDAEIEAIKAALQQLQASLEAKEIQPMAQYIVQKDTLVIERIQYIEKPVAAIENIAEVKMPVQKEESKVENPSFDREVAIFPSDKRIVRSKNEGSGRGFRLAQLSKQ